VHFGREKAMNFAVGVSEAMNFAMGYFGPTL
jgi:hypothetical protein